MSSLKQKAKALKQILWDKRLEFDKWLQSGISEYPELTEEFNDLWVRLEDAEQTLAELKQKLKELVDDFYSGYPVTRLFLRLQELLKEEKEAQP